MCKVNGSLLPLHLCMTWESFLSTFASSLVLQNLSMETPHFHIHFSSSFYHLSSLHSYFHPLSKFQVMIANGGMMKCWGCCENVNLQVGDYHLKTLFAIDMVGCDRVLGGEWHRTLGPITMDFKELYLCFTQFSHTYILKGL